MLRIADFQPDWVSAPHETIKALLAKRGMSTQRFLDLSGCDADEFDALMRAEISIDEAWSDILQKVLGVRSGFWIRLQQQFETERSALMSENLPQTEKDFVSSLPLTSMKKFGWIDFGNNFESKLMAALAFFGVESVGQYNQLFGTTLSAVAFREASTHRSKPAAIVAWLKRAEADGLGSVCDPWNKGGFENSLSEIRALTRIKDPKTFVPRLKAICARSGVAFSLVPPPDGCRASGATKFIPGEKALIVMSLRYKSDDQFWFTFFHEAAHLLLHSENALFLEDGSEVTAEEEDQANEFAGSFLVPKAFWGEIQNKRLSYKTVIAKAQKLGVSAGVLVGQLQHVGILSHDKMNFLKRRYKWTADGEAELIP